MRDTPPSATVMPARSMNRRRESLMMRGPTPTNELHYKGCPPIWKQAYLDDALPCRAGERERADAVASRQFQALQGDAGAGHGKDRLDFRRARVGVRRARGR